jgi:hypothetical protein
LGWCKLVHYLLVRTPVIGEAAEMRNDEVNVPVLRGQHFDYRRTAGDINEQRQAKGPGGLADLSGRCGIVAMNFDAAKAPSPHGLFYH